MHTPTKKQWQTVIDNFVRVLPLARREDHLDMMEAVVCNNNHKCGTVHCVGGWYAVAALFPTGAEYIGFHDGCNKMAEDLGFNYENDLELWAHHNPEVWGNEDGGSMFYDADAYDGAKNLHEVIAFLEKVKDRSPE